MRKIRVVYNKITGEIIPHIWNKNGTVTITKEISREEEDNIIVSLVEMDRVDLECGYVYTTSGYVIPVEETDD